MSPYKTFKELEDAFNMNKLQAAAKEFYLDETKKLSERIKVFDKYGKVESYIHEPEDVALKAVFKDYGCDGNTNRYETIDCSDVIDHYLERLKDLKDKNKNKKPSELALKRLRAYYFNKLFQEGVAKFEFDW